MTLFSLSLAYLRQRSLTTVLNLLLLALGVATIVVLLLVNRQMEGRLARDAAGIDLVVGAKGSPLQLILSAVYHVDIPTGNIPLAEAEALSADPLVKQTIPVALGDNFMGYRIVGPPPAYPAHYGAALADGRLFELSMEATVGATVARAAKLRVGDLIVGSHGVGGEGHAHADHPFEVVGILEPTGTVLDRLVLTPVESVWDVHAAHGHDAAASGRGREVTAVLVTYASPLAAARLPRRINQDTGMQAASPASELVRLLSLVGVGLDAMRAFGFVLIVSAALGTFVALYNSLQQRRYDLAVMRSLGGTRRTLVLQLVTEAMTVSLAGTLLGLGLGHGAAVAAGHLFPQAQDLGVTGFVFLAEELWLFALAAVIALLAAALPAVQVYRADVSAVLARG